MSYIPHSANPDVVHDLSWFGNYNEFLEDSVEENDSSIPVYTKLPITIDNFKEEVNKKLYTLKRFDVNDIPDDCAFIKFSYTSEHKEPILIEEENIAIIQDGKRGESAINVYASAYNYQFRCDENFIPFNDTCYIDLYVKQGNENLVIESVSLSSEETTFTDSLYNAKVGTSKENLSDGTSKVINSQSATVAISILRNSRKAKDKIICSINVTYIKPNKEKESQTLQFLATSISTGVYLGMMTSISFVGNKYILTDRNGKKYIQGENLNNGDYFLWGGATITTNEYNFIQSLVYVWNGSDFERDSDPNHALKTFDDIIYIADNLNETSDTVKVFKNLTAAVLNVGKLFANKITLMNSNNKYGLIKSSNYSDSNISSNQTISTLGQGQTGWAIDGKGQAEFHNMYANGGIFNEIVTKDPYIPLINPLMRTKDSTVFKINLNTMNANEIISIFDKFLDSSTNYEYIDYADITAKRVYTHIIPNDNKNVLQYSKTGAYIERKTLRTYNSNFQRTSELRYSICSNEQERIIIANGSKTDKNGNGNLYGLSKEFFCYADGECVFANAFKGLNTPYLRAYNGIILGRSRDSTYNYWNNDTNGAHGRFDLSTQAGMYDRLRLSSFAPNEIKICCVYKDSSYYIGVLTRNSDTFTIYFNNSTIKIQQLNFSKIDFDILF